MPTVNIATTIVPHSFPAGTALGQMRFRLSVGAIPHYTLFIDMPLPAAPCAILMRSRQTRVAKSHRQSSTKNTPGRQGPRIPRMGPAWPLANTAARSAKAPQ